MKKTLSFLLLTLLCNILHAQQNDLISSLEVFDITSNSRQVVLSENTHFEAPNWSAEDNSLIINQNGLLFKVAIDGKSKEKILTGKLKNLNNDHGISFDGAWLAVSNNDAIAQANSGSSRIYLVPASGGKERLMTPLYPSYWHGWSPDGKNLLYTAKRNGQFDIYRMAIEGQTEERLTNSPNLNDGPEYSPDGKYIYFNTLHNASMEIWRMQANGENHELITDDAYSNWFAHPSPDGRHIVFISYLKDQGADHPAMKDVALRLYRLKDKSIRTLCSFTGGQGSLNVPSWSSDSNRFAFVSYKSVERNN